MIHNERLRYFLLLPVLTIGVMLMINRLVYQPESPARQIISLPEPSTPSLTLDELRGISLGNREPLHHSGGSSTIIPPIVPGFDWRFIERNRNPDRTEGRKGARAGREELLHYMLTYPGHTIPVNARQEAYNLLQTQTAAARPNGAVWQSIGPAALEGGNMGAFQIDSAGRTTAILVHPQNPNIVYTAGAQGGVWKTTNGGESWTPLTDGQPSLAIGSMAFAPTNSNIIYVGTGEPHGSADSYYGAGILKSTDGGATWVQLGADRFLGMGIAGIVINPDNPNIVYAAASASVSSGHPQPELPGIYKTTNGGLSWTRLVSACNDQGQCASPSALVMDPDDPDVLFLGMDEVGIYQSVDGGASWSAALTLQEPIYRAEVAISPTNGNVLYAGLEVLLQDGSSIGILFKSVDGGASWAEINTLETSYCGEQCSYNNVVAVHPTNPDIVLAGGQALYSDDVPGIDGIIFKSSNGGLSWSYNSGVSAATTIHPDLHAIAFAPSNPNIIWIGNDGGVYRSTNGGNTWEARNGNLGTLQFQSVALHPTNPDILFGGMQDNAKAKTINGGRRWVGLDAGDGGFAAIDPFNPVYWYGTRFSISGSFMQFQRNDHNGSIPFSDWPVKSNGINLHDRVLFYAPLAVDPNVAGRVYWGTHRLYRSNNRGESWSAISPDLTRNESGYSAISNLAVLSGNSNVILVGTADGNVQLTTNGGTSWTNLTKPPLPNRYVSDVAIQDAQTFYVTYQGFGANTPGAPGHVYKTTNAGQTWNDVSHTNQAHGLPDLPVLAIALDRESAGIVYVGTDLGVYRSSDGGAHWMPFNEGFPTVAVFDLALQAYPDGNKYLVAATHGRSMWRVSLEPAQPPTQFKVFLSLIVGGGRATTPPLPTPTPGVGNTPTPTATTLPPTSTPSATSTPVPTATMEPPPLVPNGDFEQGANGDWIEFSSSGFALITDYAPITPRSGRWLAWLGGADNEESDLYQVFTMPAGASLYLNFYYQIDSQESGCYYDLAGVLIDDTLIWAEGLCQSNNTNSWQRVSLDLSSYAGQTLAIHFQALTDSSINSSFLIDDVSFEAAP